MSEFEEPLETDDLWKELNEKRRRACERYKKYVADTELNLAFLSGNQWVKYVMSEGITPIANETNEIREVDDRIFPAYIRMMYGIYGDNPTITAYEGGLEVHDSMAAKAVEALCDYLNNNNGWRQARIKAGAWMMVAGTAYIMPFWKRNARYTGKRKKYDYVDTPVESPKGLTHILTKEVDSYEADISFAVLSPMSSYCFPLDASSWNEVQEFMTVSLSSIEALERKLGRKLDEEELTPHSNEDVNFRSISRINRYVSYDLGYAQDVSETDVRYLEIQYWQRPCPRYPRGRYVHAYGGKIAHDGPLPYFDIARRIDPGDNFNITMGIIPQFSYIVPGVLHPRSPVSIWRAPQVRINSLLTDQSANRKTVGRNKLIYEEGTIANDAYTDEHGEMIPIRPGGGSFAPQFIQAAPLAGIDGEMDRAEYSFQQVTGQTLAVQGRNDTQVRSAQHFELLRENASVVNWMIFDQSEENDNLVAKFCIEMIRKYWSDSRTLDAIGHDRAIYFNAFKGMVTNMDVRFKRGSALARNYVLREETLEKLLQYGLFNQDMDPKMRTLFIKALELGSLIDATDYEAPHRNRANFENLQMSMGIAIEPRSEENHLIHVEEHNRFLQTYEGRALPANAQAIILGHIQYHNYLYSDQMAPGLNNPPTPIRGLGDIQMYNRNAAGGGPAQPAGAAVPPQGSPQPTAVESTPAAGGMEQ